MDDLRRLRAFIVVCDEGTITAAAVALRIAQPALSRQIQSLERELGVRLFTRNGPRLHLTPAGRHLSSAARDVIAQSDRLRMAAQEIARGELAHLTIAVAPTTLSEVLAPFIAHLGVRAPLVAVETVEGSRVHDSVIDRCDFGISGEAIPVRSLDWLELTSVPLRAYVSSRHEWAQRGRREIPVGELVRHELLLPMPDDPTRAAFDAAVRAAGSQFARFTELPSPRIVQATASAGHGVGIATDLPRFEAHPMFVTTADGTPVSLDIHACWPRGHFAADALRRFADELNDYTKGFVGPAAWEL